MGLEENMSNICRLHEHVLTSSLRAYCVLELTVVYDIRYILDQIPRVFVSNVQYHSVILSKLKKQ